MQLRRILFFIMIFSLTFSSLVIGFFGGLKFVLRGTTNGVFLPHINVIIMEGKNDRWDMVDTFYHERGHYVYYNLLSAEERQEWKELYKNEGRSVSYYASKNEKEDFAEQYRSMYSGQYTCLFIEEVIKEYSLAKFQFLYERLGPPECVEDEEWTD